MLLGRPYDRKFHVKTINNAKIASWNSYVAKFSSEKSKLYYENEEKFLKNLDSYIISFDVLDAECSEKKEPILFILDLQSIIQKLIMS